VKVDRTKYKRKHTHTHTVLRLVVVGMPYLCGKERVSRIPLHLQHELVRPRTRVECVRNRPLPGERVGDPQTSDCLQQTVSHAVNVTGIGLHSGLPSKVTIWPTKAGIGRIFVRRKKASGDYEALRSSLSSQEAQFEKVDGAFDLDCLGAFHHLPAHISHAEFPARLCTVLASPADGSDKFRFQLTEHLLSALEGCGVHNCVIEHSGPGDELPILDGSAKTWAELIAFAGTADAIDRHPYQLLRPSQPKRCVTVTGDDGAFVSFIPGGGEVRLTCGIDFSHKSSAIGSQWFTHVLHHEKRHGGNDDNHSSRYVQSVSPAKTFCCYEDIDAMKSAGLIKGGGVDNALIADGPTWVNPDMLSFPRDEQARHKVLDLVGDLALMAQGGNCALPLGHFLAFKAGHQLHLRFAKELLQQTEND